MCRTKKLIKPRSDFASARRRMIQTTDVRGSTKAHFSNPTTPLSTHPASGSGSDFYANARGGEEQRRAMIPQNLKSQSTINGVARRGLIPMPRKGRKGKKNSYCAWKKGWREEPPKRYVVASARSNKPRITGCHLSTKAHVMLA